MTDARKGPANPTGERFALQVMAVAGGAGAVGALPLLTAYAVNEQGPAQVVALVFAFPLAMVAIGRLREHRGLQIAAGVVAALVALLLVARPGLVVFVLAVGAPVSLVLVGKYLLEQDRLAGGAWLLCTSIGLIAGFLAAGGGLAGTVGAVLLMLTVACLVALQRLRRRARDDVADG